jgi:hypothetical protein
MDYVLHLLLSAHCPVKKCYKLKLASIKKYIIHSAQCRMKSKVQLQLYIMRGAQLIPIGMPTI